MMRCGEGKETDEIAPFPAVKEDFLIVMWIVVTFVTEGSIPNH